MAKKKIKNGPVTIEVPDYLVPPKGAGTLSPAQVQALVKPRPGLGVVCDAAADALENDELDFQAPKGITPAILRKAGERAEGMDLIVKHLENTLEMYKQGNLIVDAEAFELISKLNDQIKVQGKRDKTVLTAFAGVTAYFKKTAKTSKKKAALRG